MIIECSSDWFAYHHRWMQMLWERSWVKVVDADRKPNGSHDHLLARLALKPVTYIPPAWGPHISVIRGECARDKNGRVDRRFRDLWGKYEGERIMFTFDPHMGVSSRYMYFRVMSRRLNDIRAELGLPPNPTIKMHLTVGVKDGNLV